MRTFIFCLLAVIALAVILILQPESAKIDTLNQYGMPWQITVENNQSRVFGLTLAANHAADGSRTHQSSTLADVIKLLGSDYELAVLAKPEQRGDLELFYTRFQTGPIQGKLIVGIDAPDALISAITQAPGKQEYLDNGTKKFQLSADQKQAALNLAIKSLTLAPTARLDDSLLRERFGEPTAIIGVGQQISHYVYKALGLAVRVDNKGKDMLHYVSPTFMDTLIAQLRLEAIEDVNN